MSKVDVDGGTARPRIDREFDRIEALLASLAGDDDARAEVEDRLRRFQSNAAAFLSAGRDDADEDDLSGASDDELLEALDRELESP
jgi:hypothetical protein